MTARDDGLTYELSDDGAGEAGKGARLLIAWTLLVHPLCGMGHPEGSMAGRLYLAPLDHHDGDGQPDQVVHLDAIDPQKSRHLVIVLDGIPFDVLKEFRDAGRLRVFHRPAEVVPPYPVMTDLALEDVFAYMPCEGFEAKYFSRPKRRIAGGTGEYLAGRNEPFVRIISYRGATLDDALAYLDPRPMFYRELHEVKRRWDRREDNEAVMYMVSTAALGSREGKAGQLLALAECERLINQVLFETGGLAKVTLLADHGQSNVPCKPAGLDGFLRSRGWRLTDRPREKRDVALVRFGLVTCAAFGTPSPAALVDDLLASDAVELASYADGDTVVVRARGAAATISSADGKTFRYAPTQGDPLGLAELASGEVNGRDILKATVQSRHNYPDALYRLWR
ncbi:hypothetical protein LCGC14_2597370, partial [marine sediment metagenome]